MKLLLEHLWCLPYSLIGFLLFQTYGATGYKVRNGVLIVRVKRIWLGYKQTAGQTQGGVMAIKEGSTDDVFLLDHEEKHSLQFFRWGLLMGPAYGIACLVALFRGGHFYRDNYFEKEADVYAHKKAATRRSQQRQKGVNALV